MDDSQQSPDPSDWLDAKIIECDNCQQKLYWLWHSPMYDEWFIYCTNCPKWVEVSFYDEEIKPFWKNAEEAHGINKHKLFRSIEEALSPCDCGGQFRFDAVRHCLHCGGPLKQSEPGRDVSFPEAGDEKIADDPKACEEWGRKIDAFVRRTDIWKSAQS